MRDHITMINRRRCLAENLNACTMEEIRQEVASALHRKFPGRGHAVHCAAEIIEATQEYGQPPREIEAQISFDDPPARNVLAWIAAGLVVAVIGFGAYHAVSATLDGIERYEGEFRRG